MGATYMIDTALVGKKKTKCISFGMEAVAKLWAQPIMGATYMIDIALVGKKKTKCISFGMETVAKFGLPFNIHRDTPASFASINKKEL